MMTATQIVESRFLVCTETSIRTFDALLSIAYENVFGIEPDLSEDGDFKYEYELFSTIVKCYDKFMNKPYDISVHKDMIDLLKKCSDMDYSSIDKRKDIYFADTGFEPLVKETA